MKSQQNWFAEYAVSHQNPKNQSIHYICVPVIYFSIVGMLFSIKSEWLRAILPFKSPLLTNWATVFLIVVLFFYFTLSIKTFFRMLFFSIFSLVVNYYLSNYINVFYFNLVLFVIAWVGQFYGHKIEGKKPSFFKDIQFLLIGPAWVFEKMFG